MDGTETERVRAAYERFAPAYDGWMRYFDRVLLGGARERLCRDAAGETWRSRWGPA